MDVSDRDDMGYVLGKDGKIHTVSYDSEKPWGKYFVTCMTKGMRNLTTTEVQVLAADRKCYKCFNLS